MRMRNHDSTIPVVQDNMLIYQRGGQDCQLLVGTSAWYAWLGTATTFAVRSAFGTFRVHKERAGNKRGGWYWRAYRKHEGTLHRVYLGKSEELTRQRLNAVSAILAGRDGVVGDEREPAPGVLQGQPEVTCDQRHFTHPTPGASCSPAERGDASESATRHHSTLPV